MDVSVDFPKNFRTERRDGRPTVYDGFTFYNELEILDIRLHELADVVDYFVVVEARQTFQGVAKPLMFLENRQRFAAFADKIIHVVVENFDAPGRRYAPIGARRLGPAWRIEGAQRNAIQDGFAHAGPQDWLIVSDVDEIPRADVVGSIAQHRMHDRCGFVFEHKHYQNCLNWRVADRPVTYGARMIQKRVAPAPHTLRRRLRQVYSRTAPLPWLTWRAQAMARMGALIFVQIAPAAGWHFSSIGDVARISGKMRAYSHWTDPGHPEFMAPEKISSRLADGRTHEGLSVRLAPLRELPAHVAEAPERYAELLDPRGLDAAAFVAANAS